VAMRRVWLMAVAVTFAAVAGGASVAHVATTTAAPANYSDDDPAKFVQGEYSAAIRVPDWLRLRRAAYRGDPAPSRLVGAAGVAAEEAATVARGWRVGDPIDALTRAGNEPAWSTVRARYWKNAAAAAEEGEYSAANLARMQAGRPPLHDELGVPMELHHLEPRAQGGTNAIENLAEVWPWEHAADDPFRFYSGPVP
jgi:hypothetical protein